MPVRRVRTAAPPPVVQPPIPLPPPLHHPEHPYVTWTPNGGDTIVLSEARRSGFHIGGIGKPGRIVGLDMPPEVQFDTEMATSDGAMLRHARALPRNFSMDMLVHADSQNELEQHRRALVRAFDRRRGEGVFSVGQPDGTVRSLNALYFAGLDDPVRGRTGGGSGYHDAYVVQLRARDPYPYGPERRETFDGALPIPQEFFPGPPWHISESNTTGDAVVIIDGEVDVYQLWVITGPGELAILRNRDTGQVLNLTPSLTAGQKLYIRTDPNTAAESKFTNADGVSKWESSAGDFPVLWPLAPGRNRVTVTLTGVAASSKVELFYRPRYLIA